MSTISLRVLGVTVLTLKSFRNWNLCLEAEGGAKQKSCCCLSHHGCSNLLPLQLLASRDLGGLEKPNVVLFSTLVFREEDNTQRVLFNKDILKRWKEDGSVGKGACQWTWVIYIPGTCMVDRENWFLKLFFDHTCTIACSQTQINRNVK